MRGVTASGHTLSRSTKFLLTRLMRGVTPTAISSACMPILFLLTRLMRGVTDIAVGVADISFISTHTPHARRDFWCTRL